jgi:hypothetical protein
MQTEGEGRQRGRARAMLPKTNFPNMPVLFQTGPEATFSRLYPFEG